MLYVVSLTSLRWGAVRGAVHGAVVRCGWYSGAVRVVRVVRWCGGAVRVVRWCGAGGAAVRCVGACWCSCAMWLVQWRDDRSME